MFMVFIFTLASSAQYHEIGRDEAFEDCLRAYLFSFFHLYWIVVKF